ncbi:MAG TPA: hypothetical protein VJV78_16995 [Polyangiales bacterium]|nr:hypothetical protein [Polyangiales bacterium]
MKRWRLLVGGLALLAWLDASAERAAAFAEPERFGQPTNAAGGGGRWFTGSPAEGFSCAVCHEGGAQAPLQVLGLPEGSYQLGNAYEITARWPPTSDKISLALELTDATGHPAGSVRLPPADELLVPEFCEPADAQIEAGVANTLPDGRVVLSVPDCGAKQLRFLWTAPVSDVGPVWLSGSLVQSDGMGDMLGDGVTDVLRVMPAPRSDVSGAAQISAGCSAGGHGSPAAASGMLLVLLLSIRARFARSRNARRP